MAMQVGKVVLPDREIVVQSSSAIKAFEAERARADRLLDALRTYGRHHFNCAVTKSTMEGRVPSGKPCSCGFAEALADRTS